MRFEEYCLNEAPYDVALADGEITRDSIKALSACFDGAFVSANDMLHDFYQLVCEGANDCKMCRHDLACHNYQSYTPRGGFKKLPLSGRTLEFLNGFGFLRVSFLIFGALLVHDMRPRSGFV